MNKKASLDTPVDTVGGKRRILVVDGSRVVRATLAKRLGECFDIVEEENGESAWQRLMLDGSIATVISGIHPPRLEAKALRDRLKASALRRLREMPFVLIVSDIENQPGYSTGEWQGFSGFITKSMTKSAMVAQLDGLFGHCDSGASPAGAGESPATGLPDSATPQRGPEKLLQPAEFATTLSSLSFSTPPDSPVCLLVFGIDHLDELTARFGADLPKMLTSRIAKLLAAKVDPKDVLGLCGKRRLAIVSHGVDLRQGAHFGKRVCKSLASGQITISAQKIKLTVSVGVASTSDDTVSSGRELFSLAEQRLEQALVCGGNTVCMERRPHCPMNGQDKSLIALVHVLRSGRGELPPDEKSKLANALLPLLQTLDTRLSLGLPLADIQKRFPALVEAKETAM